MILLDTNIVIAFLNGNKAIAERIKDNIDKIALSTLVVAELNYGAKASQNASRNIDKLTRLLDLVRTVPFDLECADSFGTIKSKLRNIGKPTGEVDAFIGATAIAHKAILVTGSKKHFEHIEGLRVETWPLS
jgi:tRNA(fMet)-specific endonuclease VapC